jgi:hypothetical protein
MDPDLKMSLELSVLKVLPQHLSAELREGCERAKAQDDERRVQANLAAARLFALAHEAGLREVFGEPVRSAADLPTWFTEEGLVTLTGKGVEFWGRTPAGRVLQKLVGIFGPDYLVEYGRRYVWDLRTGLEKRLMEEW